MIDWGAGYRATWSLMEVDPSTWEDVAEVPDVLSVSVERDGGQLYESGSAEVTLPVGGSFGERWCRVEMLAEQGGEAERVKVATLLMSMSSAETSHGRQAVTLEGRSTIAPAADETLLAGTTVQAGSDGAAEAAALVGRCTPAPVAVHGSFRLSEHVVFARGTTCAEAAWMLLDAAGWRMWVDGDGTVNVGPYPTEPDLVLGLANASLLSTSVTSEGGISQVPNRYVAVDDAEVAIAVNLDGGDPSSYAARGRYVDTVDESPVRVDGESLREYADRKLAEKRLHAESRTYSREWWPGVAVGSVVRGGLASSGLGGDMRVTAQSLACGAGLLVTETAEVM